mmetsp:Transcript_30004/g.58874  ORF Transcript_30004/g.58874 Transcript_30004/m.58874 type:complete len:408 (-) Transcript_30004:577-1800(-)
MSSSVPAVNEEALKSEIRKEIITNKANACPMVVRLAWHAAGTYSQADGTGGSNGATMRFAPEADDDANAGLSIVRDMLLPVKKAHPEISFADLWVAAGCAAIEFLGGPKVPFKFGRTDAPSGAHCPAIGRLPDGAQGAQHLRDVFYRMGFSDQEIVALSGAHTLGRCHKTRSGFDGPWTRNPLKFDNQYFRLLLNLEWKEKEWDGPKQYVDADTEELMMLPSDLAIRDDSSFRQWAEKYAKDEQLFFQDFAKAFSKLMANGCPAHVNPSVRQPRAPKDEQAFLDGEVLEHSMHGSLGHVQKMVEKGGNPHAIEKASGRTALHKAAFWGHDHMIEYLVSLRVNANVQDYAGDTPLHDAARFGHQKCVELLMRGGGDWQIKNKDGKDVSVVALDYGKENIAKMLRSHRL